MQRVILSVKKNGNDLFIKQVQHNVRNVRPSRQGLCKQRLGCLLVIVFHPLCKMNQLHKMLVFLAECVCVCLFVFVSAETLIS